MRELRETPEAVGARIDLGPLGTSLGFLLRLSQVELFEMFYSVLGHHGLKPGEFSVLWIVHLNPGIRQGRLADRLRIKRAHMTKLIRAFEDRGFVLRHVPDADRRAVELTLAPPGEAFVAEHAEAFFSYARTETQRLSDGEAEQFVALLRKFAGLGGAS